MVPKVNLENPMSPDKKVLVEDDQKSHGSCFSKESVEEVTQRKVTSSKFKSKIREIAQNNSELNKDQLNTSKALNQALKQEMCLTGKASRMSTTAQEIKGSLTCEAKEEETKPDGLSFDRKEEKKKLTKKQCAAMRKDIGDLKKHSNNKLQRVVRK
jgi:hypothetical protein